jgi:hypothetical protein
MHSHFVSLSKEKPDQHSLVLSTIPCDAVISRMHAVISRIFSPKHASYVLER